MRRGQSTARAIKRGHMTTEGFIVPTRPFNNRKPTFGRNENELRKREYEYCKKRFNSIEG